MTFLVEFVDISKKFYQFLQTMITYGIFGAIGLAALAYFDMTQRSSQLSGRISTLEETYENLIGKSFF